ncbi:E3 ubiquitin-protein ligase NEURL1 isoform X4 [Canis aureus]
MGGQITRSTLHGHQEGQGTEWVLPGHLPIDSIGGPFPVTSHRCHHKQKHCPPVLPGGGLPATPLLFHPHTKGSQILMDLSHKAVKRQASFCNAITFSNRPVLIYEQVRLKITKKQCCWSGALRLGFTSKDPSRIHPDSLPKYACPDLVSQSGFWAKALPEEFANEGNIIAFWVDKKGRVFYRINDSAAMLFFNGVRTADPLWALVDVYGLTRGVQLLVCLVMIKKGEGLISSEVTFKRKCWINSQRAGAPGLPAAALLHRPAAAVPAPRRRRAAPLREPVRPQRAGRRRGRRRRRAGRRLPHPAELAQLAAQPRAARAARRRPALPRAARRGARAHPRRADGGAPGARARRARARLHQPGRARGRDHLRQGHALGRRAARRALVRRHHVRPRHAAARRPALQPRGPGGPQGVLGRVPRARAAAQRRHPGLGGQRRRRAAPEPQRRRGGHAAVRGRLAAALDALRPARRLHADPHPRLHHPGRAGHPLTVLLPCLHTNLAQRPGQPPLRRPLAQHVQLRTPGKLCWRDGPQLTSEPA